VLEAAFIAAFRTARPNPPFSRRPHPTGRSEAENGQDAAFLRAQRPRGSPQGRGKKRRLPLRPSAAGLKSVVKRPEDEDPNRRRKGPMTEKTSRDAPSCRPKQRPEPKKSKPRERGRPMREGIRYFHASTCRRVYTWSHREQGGRAGSIKCKGVARASSGTHNFGNTPKVRPG
jgi:hypothetical protein